LAPLGLLGVDGCARHRHELDGEPTGGDGGACQVRFGLGQTATLEEEAGGAVVVVPLGSCFLQSPTDEDVVAGLVDPATEAGPGAK